MRTCDQPKMPETPVSKQITPRPSLSRLLQDPSPKFVTIFVSTQPAKFVVHKDLICYHSPFFQAAFNGSFAESDSQEMRLEDIEPEIFGMVASWIYREAIDNDDQEPGATESEEMELLREGQYLLRLAKLWKLAQRFLMPALQNMAMDEIYEFFEIKLCQIRIDAYVEFYEFICAEDVECMIRFMVEIMLVKVNEENFLDTVDFLPFRFVAALCKKLRLNAYVGLYPVSDRIAFRV